MNDESLACGLFGSFCAQAEGAQEGSKSIQLEVARQGCNPQLPRQVIHD